MRLRRAGDSTSPRQDTGGPFDPLRGHTWAREGATLKFRWPALENGTYSLVVEAPGFAEPLLVLADVVVPAPANGDPRLDPLDLRELVGTLLVRIPSGLAEGTRVLVFPQPQADDRVWDGFEMGRELRIAVPKRPVDLLFAASERRPTMVRGAVDVVDVTLEPWPRVELRVLGADALPAGVQLRAYARSPGKPEKPERQYRTANSGGGLSLYLAAPTSAPEVKDGVAMLTVGEGVSDLAFWVALDPRGRPTPLKKFTPNQIVAGAPVTVHLDADELRAAIEKLQQDAPSKK